MAGAWNGAGRCQGAGGQGAAGADGLVPSVAASGSPRSRDESDALAAARLALRAGVDALPYAYLDERAMGIRVFAEDRCGMVAEDSRAQKRLPSAAMS